jgi:four helix bundle protein
MKLEELNVYRLSMEMAERIWEIVVKWDYFTKDTVGKQLVRSADSIAANLDDTITRRIQISAIIQEDHYMKLKPGL